MEPRIEIIQSKKLIGCSATMSLANNKTGQLWGAFVPRIKQITNRVSLDKISLQVYPADYYKAFSSDKEFVKWAAVEVKNHDTVPEGMEVFDLEGGMYAVFDYRGSSADPSIFQYIFTEWIPNSEFEVDDRPHFEVLGVKYRNNDPESEEEIWIPIKDKMIKASS